MDPKQPNFEIKKIPGKTPRTQSLFVLTVLLTVGVLGFFGYRYFRSPHHPHVAQDKSTGVKDHSSPPASSPTPSPPPIFFVIPTESEKPVIEQLPKEAGAKSLAYYKSVCVIMEKWSDDLSQAKKIGNLEGSQTNVKGLTDILMNALKNAVNRLKNLERNEADDRIVEITAMVRKRLEGQQNAVDLLAAATLLSKADDPMSTRSIQQYVAILERIWGPQFTSSKHSYERWLNERYGMDASDFQSK
jgi:hypothetical protein